MEKKKLIILISCMNQKDKEIIKRSNVQNDVVVINQSDKEQVEEWDFVNRSGLTCHAKFISTKERGLSRSRNMAIENAWGDVCLICDDDEWLSDDIEQIVIKAYETHKNASVITFAFDRKDKTYRDKSEKLGVKGIVRTSSVEITFKREDIVNNKIEFDVNMGSGSGNGAGEENKFLMDIYRKGLKMVYEPKVIANLLSTESMWFCGYNEAHFRNWGWSTRRALGTGYGALYMIYALVVHRKLYAETISIWNAAKNMISGFFEKREKDNN